MKYFPLYFMHFEEKIPNWVLISIFWPNEIQLKIIASAMAFWYFIFFTSSIYMIYIFE